MTPFMAVQALAGQALLLEQAPCNWQWKLKVEGVVELIVSVTGKLPFPEAPPPKGITQLVALST